MARKSRYMGYVNGYEELKEKHAKRREIKKEKSLTKKLNQYNSYTSRILELIDP